MVLMEDGEWEADLPLLGDHTECALWWSDGPVEDGEWEADLPLLGDHTECALWWSDGPDGG